MYANYPINVRFFKTPIYVRKLSHKCPFLQKNLYMYANYPINVRFFRNPIYVRKLSHKCPFL